jgi:hypothetical protein
MPISALINQALFSGHPKLAYLQSSLVFALFLGTNALQLQGPLKDTLPLNPQDLAAYLYSLQYKPQQDPPESGGFLPSHLYRSNCPSFLFTNINFTMAALAILKGLGDDLSRASKPHLMAAVKETCRKGFVVSEVTQERDVRAVLSTVLICEMLGEGYPEA